MPVAARDILHVHFHSEYLAFLGGWEHKYTH